MRRGLVVLVLTLAVALGSVGTAHAQYDEEAPGEVVRGDRLLVDPADPGSADASLARTGSNLDLWVKVGIVLTGAGALMVLASRKRTWVVRQPA